MFFQFGEPRQKPRFHQVFAGAGAGVRKNGRGLPGPRSVYTSYHFSTICWTTLATNTTYKYIIFKQSATKKFLSEIKAMHWIHGLAPQCSIAVAMKQLQPVKASTHILTESRACPCLAYKWKINARGRQRRKHEQELLWLRINEPANDGKYSGQWMILGTTGGSWELLGRLRITGAAWNYRERHWELPGPAENCQGRLRITGAVENNTTATDNDRVIKI